MTDFCASPPLPTPSGAPLTGLSPQAAQGPAPMAPTPPTAPIAPTLTLAQLALGQAMQVHSVQAPAHAPEWADWLAEIGFVAGEAVKVLSQALPGGDPLVVRIGLSTFALRRAEAACVLVQAAVPGGAGHD